jgi:hypothetical protein
MVEIQQERKESKKTSIYTVPITNNSKYPETSYKNYELREQYTVKSTS